jgi:hypothetical protein
MRDKQPEEPDEDRDGDEEESDEERDSDEEEPDEQTTSAPTRAGSNVPNAGRDPDQDRTE